MNVLRNEMPIEALKSLLGAGTGKDPAISPDIEMYNEEFKRRVLWLETEVDSSPIEAFPAQENIKSTMEIVKAIERFNAEDKGKPVEERVPIKIKINTPGGDVHMAIALCSAIALSKTPVYTIAVSMAMSAGAHILAAGHKRFAYPGSTVLVHSGSVFMGGDVEKAESMRKYYNSMSEKFNNELIARTKIDPKMLKKKGAFDWYMSAEEALEYGIVDKIVDDLDEII